MSYFVVKFQKKIDSPVENFVCRAGSTTEALFALVREHQHPIIWTVDESDPQGHKLECQDE